MIEASNSKLSVVRGQLFVVEKERVALRSALNKNGGRRAADSGPIYYLIEPLLFAASLCGINY